MTDIIATTSIPAIELPAPADGRAGMIGELARAEAAVAEAQAKLAALEAENARLRTEQITDGSDPRLEDFWEKGGRIADAAGFCEEYDRIADALNGTPRTRDWDVVTDVQITVRVSRCVSATTEQDAIDFAEEEIDAEAVIEAIRMNGWDDIEYDNREASRA